MRKKFLKFLKFGVVVAAIIGASAVFSHVQAANFEAKLQSSYTIFEASGTAKVNHNFSVTNTAPTTFIDSYQLTFDRDNLQNLVIDPKKEEISKTIEKDNGVTKIDLQFENEVVGEGKSRVWSVNYDDPNAATFTGQVAEISIPLLATSDQYSDYELIVKVPSHLGEPTKINLEPSDVRQVGGDFTQYTWENTGNQKQLMMVFGANQNLNFDLHYQLHNQSGDTFYGQIALPGDDPWQVLTYQHITPAPQALERDGDGNYLATYELKAGEELAVNASGQAVLIEQNNVAVAGESGEINKFLATANFWETKNPVVIEFAKEAGDARGIYQRLVENFTYAENEESVRQGAVQTIETASGVCEDFVDVFVAAARAQGIPASRVVGWTNESTDATLHVWAQWYDTATQTWHRVDPTFGNTAARDYFDNFDLFHFALVKNGYYSSEMPAPAQSINVQYSNEPSASSAAQILAPEIKIEMRKLGFLPLPGVYDLVIKNPNGRTFSDLTLTIQPNHDTIEVKNERGEKTVLLPFQTQRLALSVYNKQWYKLWQTGELSAILQSNNKNIYVTNTQEIISCSFIGLAAGAGLVALAFTAGSILVARRKK